MHILGLCVGSVHGNSEILLKAALSSAVAHDSSISVSWIHVPSVVIPRMPKPLRDDNPIIPEGDDKVAKTEPKSLEHDDRRAVLKAVMDADALIISTPIYTHQPPGTLKELVDYILGPYVDTSTALRKLARKNAGEPGFENVNIDPREVKPRVAGFIGVCGSAAQFTEQWTMALPTLHLVAYPIHAKVIDQALFPGNANAGAVLIDPACVERVKTLGARVASQIGKPYDEAQYLGPEEKGSCPYCHLLKIEFREGNTVQCIVCGALGNLSVGSDGDIRPIWEEDSVISCMTLKGKWKHTDDIKEQLAMERSKLPATLKDRDYWRNVQIPLVHLPSMTDDMVAALSKSHI